LFARNAHNIAIKLLQFPKDFLWRAGDQGANPQGASGFAALGGLKRTELMP
jgi:hypothetical protein